MMKHQKLALFLLFFGIGTLWSCEHEKAANGYYSKEKQRISTQNTDQEVSLRNLMPFKQLPKIIPFNPDEPASVATETEYLDMKNQKILKILRK